jgi:uncharacterized protein (TIGR02118 family)
MVRRISFTRRAAGVSYPDFQSHWRGPHAELARHLPGLRRYVQNHAVLGPDGPWLPYPGFDVCADLTFEDAEAVQAALSSPEYRAAAIADEEGFSDMTHLTSMIIEAAVGPETEPDAGAVKLMTFLRRSAQFERARFVESLLGPYAVAPAGASVARELLLAADEAGAPPAFDAVDTLWFRDVREALRFTTSPAAQAARWELGGLVAGAERLLAREVRVSG